MEAAEVTVENAQSGDAVPDSSVSNEKLCDEALNSDGLGWNTTNASWVEEAKRRKHTLKICKFYRKRLAPERPDGTMSAKDVCSKALDGDDWNGSNVEWVNEAKMRGYDLVICNSCL